MVNVLVDNVQGKLFVECPSMYGDIQKEFDIDDVRWHFTEEGRFIIEKERGVCESKKYFFNFPGNDVYIQYIEDSF